MTFYHYYRQIHKGICVQEGNENPVCQKVSAAVEFCIHASTLGSTFHCILASGKQEAISAL